MKKRLLILVLSLLIIGVVTAQAQPLTSTASFSVRFTPVLVQETVEEGHEDGNTLISPVIRFKLAYRVSTE